MAAYIQNTFEKRFPELSGQDKEDILHEIQLKLWKMVLGKNKINNPHAYLEKITGKTALDMVKKRTPCLSIEVIGRRQPRGSFYGQALKAD